MESHAHRLELRPQPWQDPVKSVGPNMSTGIESDLGISARVDEGLQDRHFECVLCSRVEFAVGIGAGPALSEEQIALWVEFTSALKTNHRETPLSQRRTAIDEIHADSMAGQRPGGIESGRP